MAGTIRDRIDYVVAKLVGKPQVKYVSTGEAIWSAISWYGWQRKGLYRRITTKPIDEKYCWVEFRDAYGVAWPRLASISRLVDSLVELRSSTNPHYYFEPLTKVKPGAIVVDVGACEGTFALDCIIKHDATKVFCFEPDPRMAEALYISATKNQVDKKVSIVNMAVSDVPGHISLVVDEDDPLGSYVEAKSSGQEVSLPEGRYRTIIPQISIDDWVKTTHISHIDFIKIDAEGSDLAVLHGARQSIARWRPAIAVTTYHDVNHCKLMIEFLESLKVGYKMAIKGLMAFDGVPRPVMLHAVAAHV